MYNIFDIPYVLDKIKFPSNYQIRDNAKLFGELDAIVVAVKFTTDKVKYDLMFKQFNDALLENVDSAFI